MSYDLYFHKRKDSTVTSDDIAIYLNQYLQHDHELANQWTYTNEDTGVYFFIECEPIKPGETLPQIGQFENTGYYFQLNFVRPSFFGLEAFPFIERLTNALDLLIENPQESTEEPVKIGAEALYKNWNSSNLHYCAHMFTEAEGVYMPLEKSNNAWAYNFKRKQVQDKLGGEYFVPKLFFLKETSTGEVATLASWAENIPSIIPPADYFVLGRKYKKLFRNIRDEIIVSRKTILEQFGAYIQRHEGSLDIIHPTNAEKIGKKFNSLRAEFTYESVGERISADKIFNARPTPLSD